jgi:hypothetical protein
MANDTAYSVHRRKRLAPNTGPVCPDRTLLLRGILERAQRIEQATYLKAACLEQAVFQAHKLASEIVALVDEALAVPGTESIEDQTDPNFAFEAVPLARGTADLPKEVGRLAKDLVTKSWRGK